MDSECVFVLKLLVMFLVGAASGRFFAWLFSERKE